MYLKGDHIQTSSGIEQTEWERDLSLDYVIQMCGHLQEYGLHLAQWNVTQRGDAQR